MSAPSPSLNSMRDAGAAFWAVHAACLLAFYTGVTWSAFAVCLAMFWLRMFGVTAGYHRYFSHRSFKTGRVFQFVLALLGTLAVQKGVLWWAANHRVHHKYSDQEGDVHSPVRSGFWWSHVGWILAADYEETQFDRIPDMAKYPELRWLNEHYLVPPVALAVVLFLAGGLQLAGVGLLHQHHAALALDVHDQLARRTSSAAAATRPATPAATTSGWRCSPWARGGTTTTTAT